MARDDKYQNQADNQQPEGWHPEGNPQMTLAANLVLGYLFFSLMVALARRD